MINAPLIWIFIPFIFSIFMGGVIRNITDISPLSQSVSGVTARDGDEGDIGSGSSSTSPPRPS